MKKLIVFVFMILVSVVSVVDVGCYVVLKNDKIFVGMVECWVV